MRFQKGTGHIGPRRPRGPGRGDPAYRMSPKAFRARIKNAGCRKLVGGKPPRSYGETRRIEVEIALGTHRGETCRAMAKRLKCSHVHCWRVACKYRRGLIPMLPRDEQGLLAMRDSFDAPPRRLHGGGSAAHAESGDQPRAITDQECIARAQRDILERLRKRLEQEQERRRTAAKWEWRLR